MKVLQINTVVNSGSTGRIAENIGRVLMAQGHESHIAYGRGNGISESQLIKIGNSLDIYRHGFVSAAFDRHAFSSKAATKNFIRQIEKIEPDVIGLHNLHGYYLNIEILFDFLKSAKLPTLWTLHDCWSFTGHCTHFDRISCEKWKNGCFDCELKQAYPSSLFFDNSIRNYKDKKYLFGELENLTLVACSHWLGSLLSASYLSHHDKYIIHNGVDLSVFKPRRTEYLRDQLKLGKSNVILGCANIWTERKGLSDFYYLSRKQNGQTKIILIGLSRKQIKELPQGIIGIEKTASAEELAALYSVADVFVNPTYVDNFPTTNIEALACGVPVVTYNTGGSGEAVDEYTGVVVDKGDKEKLWQAVSQVLDKGKYHYSSHCVARAKDKFNKDDRYNDYVNIFKEKVSRKKNECNTQ